MKLIKGDYKFEFDVSEIGFLVFMTGFGLVMISAAVAIFWSFVIHGCK